MNAHYEVSKDNARLLITVIDGNVVRVESPTHGCFNPDFIGEPWPAVRDRFAERGFTIHGGH